MKTKIYGNNKYFRYILALFIALILPGTASAFDHGHSAFNQLLQKHVQLSENGLESKVDYAALKKENKVLNKYLLSLSEISQKEFDSWSVEQRLSFLINAYNGYTLDLILQNYPVKSIRKIGSLLKSPWKIKFIKMFGNKISLDDIEHGLIRKKGSYDEPRIHFALVCASIGCPALQNEAFVDNKLEVMLEKGLVNFLSDKTRNRYQHDKKTFKVSKIFKWYGGDFNERYGSVAKLLNKYSRYLIHKEKELPFAKKTLTVNYLDYNWDLNDTNNN